MSGKQPERNDILSIGKQFKRQISPLKLWGSEGGSTIFFNC